MDAASGRRRGRRLRVHGQRAAFERDRARDAVLQAAGYAVVRVTWRRLTEEPLAVAAALSGVLARRGV